jgi:hypothetical protein
MSSAVPQSPSSAISVNPNDTLYCSQCKRVQIPAGQAYKRCLSCREKSRNYRKRAAATRATLANLDIPNIDSAQSLVKEKRKERTEEDASGIMGRMTKKMKNGFEAKPSATSTIVSLSVGCLALRLPLLIDGYHYSMSRATPVTQNTELQRTCTKHSKAAARLPGFNFVDPSQS